MKILSRQMSVSKTYEEITHVLKTSADPNRKIILTERYFSIHCTKRRNWRYKNRLSVKGNIVKHKECTDVLLEIHANFTFYVGLIFALVGIVGVCLSICLKLQRWPVSIGLILLGILFTGQLFCDGVELLDLLELKLMREER